MSLSDRAAPGVQEQAEAVADGACRLSDAAGPGAWNLAAAEDAADAIDVLVAALSAIDQQAARILSDIPAATSALLRHLGDGGTGAGPASVPLVRRTVRAPRRGLGPGYRGIRVPADDRR
ncbi:hypothetical protein K388_07179 [Streptomyces sp. KhCrAH-43]|uniref:hypothetical protein n=1 Tax=unclassified Streptomyces TaxID=2593676 RepID=UPI00035CB731|nr:MULTISPECIES: hypothetical protein [unclassified Streptomyces]MYS39111.1 hypothetical protein [Streptomyces sp. SID4920]MYX63944.1 hypothetical protein [Streptomyces sp. SID8373]RAJ47798.1 hypothetical protein K388_07179 [Streptomyces sp. KhCrAH-43]